METKTDDILDKAFDLLEDIQTFKGIKDFHALNSSMEKVIIELHNIRTKEFDHEED